MTETTTITTAPEFTLDKPSLVATLARVEDFNERAERLKVDARVAVEEIERFFVEFKDEWGFEFREERVKVRLTGTDLVLPGGWHLAATLDLDTEGNIFRTNPHFEGPAIPEEFRVVDGTRCDHCHVARARNRSVVVWSETEGFKVVGFSCVKVFLGIAPESVIRWVTGLDDLVERNGGGGGRADIPVKVFVAAATLLTKTLGFVPRSADRGVPTADAAWDLLLFPKKFRDAHPAFNPTPAEIEDAEAAATEALDWIAANTESGDFISNLRIAAGREWVGKNAGLLAALPHSFRRNAEWEAKRAAERAERDARPPSAHIGTVGGKITATGKVVFENRTETEWGINVFFTIVTDEGNVLWLNTSLGTAAERALEVNGEPVTLTATVKDHRFNKAGAAVTVITRAKVA